MQRFVQAEIDLPLGATVDLTFSIATHTSVPVSSEELTFALDGETVEPTELIDPLGNRLHALRAGPGQLAVRYAAKIDGEAADVAVSPLDRVLFLRPSRYAESDALFSRARQQFAGLAGLELLAAVRSYVATSLTYQLGASKGTDSAVTTLSSASGVCRDFAHVAIALLRAMDVPARYAACYAPGLRPMDFHAVAEAWVDGAWHVIDATGLSDRASLVRIAVGRDAADCAWLSYHGGYVGLDRLAPNAWVLDGAERIDPAPDNGEDLVEIR